jgi:S-formylglutathione hydrolase FrmB
MRQRLNRSVFLLLIILFAGSAYAWAQGVRFRIRVSPDAVRPGEVLSGRLLIFMTAKSGELQTIGPDFTDPNAVFMTGLEVNNLSADDLLLVDADAAAFPAPFSRARPGQYQVMALLDRDHSYTYKLGPGPGDVVSTITKVMMPASSTDLTLSSSIPAPKPAVYPSNVKLIDVPSPLLSVFWGRTVTMQASVVLPPDYDKLPRARFPTVYSVHGYGGDNLSALGEVAQMAKEMTDGTRPQMVYVYLNAHSSLGHHVFADSANDGPWGTALVTELIPYLQKEFRLDPRPNARFLTGHSSGGWSSLWVMITHPDFFGGTWSTSPDPVDFHTFTGPDLTRYPPVNAFRDADGKPYPLIRFGGKELMSLEEYTRMETVLGYYGGQLASFDAVFSPKGNDGQPMKLFDRTTGRIDPFVQRAWEKYDIARVLRENWKALGPKLRGKLHIFVGTADTFHLDEPVRLLDAELKTLGSDAKIEYLEGRSHFDVYDGGLGLRIAQEMYAMARPPTKPRRGNRRR